MTRMGIIVKPYTKNWFCRTFLPSFGICTRRTISKKQADVFWSYTHQDDKYGWIRYGIYGDKIIKLVEEADGRYTVSIAYDMTKRIDDSRIVVLALEKELNEILDDDEYDRF